MADNALDELIKQQSATGLRPASPAQVDPTAPAPGFVTNANVDQVASDRYGTSFFHEPSIWERNQDPGQLRQQLKLEELKTSAARGRFDLEQAQREGPARDAFAQAKLEHEQAATKAIATHQKTLLQQDTASMNAVHGFLTDLHTPGAPKRGTPEFEDHFLATLANNPDIVHSVGGRELVKAFAEKHDTTESVAKIAEQQFEKTFGFPQSALDESRVQVGNIDPATGKMAAVGDNTGTHVLVTTPEGKQATMTVERYLKHGGKLSPATAKAREVAAPVQDLIALANKALADPKASPEHKVAAQKWLNEHTK